MTDATLTAADLDRLAAAASAWRETTTGTANCDAWLVAGNELDEVVTALLDRLRPANVTPTFPHAIDNPFQVWVYLDPSAPDAASYPDGIAMGCNSAEHAEVMFAPETLTRGFPWWSTALMVERSPGGRPATVVARHKRDISPTTWRRPESSGF